MKFSFRTLLLLAGLSLSFSACKDDDDDDDTTPVENLSMVEENGMTTITGSTTQSVTFSAGKKYFLKGFVYVRDGATLTIEPGTIIKGDKVSKASLIIQRGGKINAAGTAASPIVFTSDKAPGSRAPGDWGGIIICGRAAVNLPGGEGRIEGGPDANYGGGSSPNDADNSGVMKYVRIEYAGVAFQTDNEINGLTLGGVGSGTTLDHIQVTDCGDDSFEWFGGSVNASYLVAHRTTDDMFDTDNGFSGKVQFCLGIAQPDRADASRSNGFESDNNSGGTTATPRTAAQFANVTLLGPGPVPTTGTFNPDFGRGAHLRRNTAQSLLNTVLVSWPTGILLDDASTTSSLSEGALTSGAMKLQGIVIAASPAGKALALYGGSSTATPPVPASTYDFATVFNTPANKNLIAADIAAAGISPAAFTLTAPNLLPAPGSPLLDASQAATLPSGFVSTSYRGAFGTTDWTTGWTNFNPQATAY